MITKTTPLYSTPFLHMFSRDYEKDGETHKWDMVSRREFPLNIEKADNDILDAVVIVGVMEDLGVERFVLIEEYRPPIGGNITAFPAGLVDLGETVEEAAIREMKEETGLELTIEGTSPRLFSSPGMTDECYKMVLGSVTGTISKEFQESTENIEVLLLTLDEIKGRIRNTKMNFDAKTWLTLSSVLASRD